MVNVPNFLTVVGLQICPAAMTLHMWAVMASETGAITAVVCYVVYEIGCWSFWVYYARQGSSPCHALGPVSYTHLTLPTTPYV